MAFYNLTIDQVQQLTALNKPNVCFCATSRDGYDYTVGDHDLDSPDFADHKALLLSFGLSRTDNGSSN